MARMTAEIIEQKLMAIEDYGDPLEFLAFFLDVFDFPKATFERVHLETAPSGFSFARITNRILFAIEAERDLSVVLEEAQRILVSGKPFRYYISTDGNNILAKDTIHDLYLKCSTRELKAHFGFFLPLVGIEPRDDDDHAEIDERISVTFATLSNELALNNPRTEYCDFINRLLLLCLLIGIDERFAKKIRATVIDYCPSDGRETKRVIQHVFKSLFEAQRNDLPEYLDGLPFICPLDALSDEQYPDFNSDAQSLLSQLLMADWKNVSSDIVGAVVQATDVSDDLRMTFNYTSAIYVSYLTTPMIMREWKERLAAGPQDTSNLASLLREVQAITVFDPSCSIGSILAMTFSELKSFELELVSRLNALNPNINAASSFSLGNLVALEKNKRYAQCAAVSVALAEFRLNSNKTLTAFGESLSAAATSIRMGDPIATEWNDVCENDGHVLVVSNPEYRGSRRMTATQKRNRDQLFGSRTGTKDLDYSACWLEKGSKYIRGTTSQAAFFATNSIVQGSQVSVLWPTIFNRGISISFAHTSFKWRTAARNTNAVTVVAIGLADENLNRKKYIDNGKVTKTVANIGPYLTTHTAIVRSRNRPLGTDFPPMPKGNMPYDHGYLMLTAAERDELLDQYPDAKRFLKRVVGGDEYMNDIERWCIWTPTRAMAEEASTCDWIRARYDALRDWRLGSSASEALKREPWRFRETLETSRYSLVIPNLSSENYVYIPMGFIGKETIGTNLVFLVYDCELWLFGILSSRMHNIWTRAVAGGYETRIRYSNKLAYNTFPMPHINETQREAVSDCARNVLGERERYYERSLASLYRDMPESLAAAHRTLDLVVDKCFSERPFVDDSDRLESLFDIYEERTNE